LVFACVRAGRVTNGAGKDKGKSARLKSEAAGTWATAKTRARQTARCPPERKGGRYEGNGHTNGKQPH
jgi:hypothetical protein